MFIDIGLVNHMFIDIWADGSHMFTDIGLVSHMFIDIWTSEPYVNRHLRLGVIN